MRVTPTAEDEGKADRKAPPIRLMHDMHDSPPPESGAVAGLAASDASCVGACEGHQTSGAKKSPGTTNGECSKAPAVSAARDSVAASLEQLLGVTGGFSMLKPRGQRPAAGPTHPRAPCKALVIVMEYCDSGTLADAIRDQMFRYKRQRGNDQMACGNLVVSFVCMLALALIPCICLI